VIGYDFFINFRYAKNNLMKKLYILSLVAIVALASCGRNYTCPVYSKAETNDKAVQASIKHTQDKGKF
jgi:hypothetical protein